MIVEENRVVSVTYVITDESGETVERIDLPVSFLYGKDSGLFAQVEAAIGGKSVGDQIDVILEPKDGFGDWNPELTFTDRIENVPPEFRKVGAEAEFSNEKGENKKFRVSHVDNGSITLDGNHPFAGQKMTFSIKIADVREPTAHELQHGVDPSPGGSATIH